MADALDSKSGAREGVWVQVPLPVPYLSENRPVFAIFWHSGLFLCLQRMGAIGSFAKSGGDW